jgi:hypothetical protein
MNDKNITYTYTVNPDSWNLVVCFTPQSVMDDEIEKKLTVMSEYKDAMAVLSKFTQHGQG